MANFRKVEISIRRGSGYGHYILSAYYRGKKVETSTNDSEIFDWLEDESDKKMHLYAKQMAYRLIVAAYKAKF